MAEAEAALDAFLFSCYLENTSQQSDLLHLPSHGGQLLPPVTIDGVLPYHVADHSFSHWPDAVAPVHPAACLASSTEPSDGAQPHQHVEPSPPVVPKRARPSRPKKTSQKTSQPSSQPSVQKRKPKRACREVVMRQINACWRCRKYKKSCDENAVCSSCLVSGFRVWPSELGCRRERLSSITECYLPANFEAALLHLPPHTLKLGTWRRLENSNGLDGDRTSYTHTETTPRDDPFRQLRDAARSIDIFGPDLDGLIEICKAYQESRSRPNICLATACSLLLANCQLYRCFVRTGDNEIIRPAAEISPIVTEVRTLLYRTMMLIERLCLSAKPTDWFAATMSVSLATTSAIVFIDTMLSVPTPVREQIWGDCYTRRAWMRKGSYGMLVDLLRASTKGVNPLKLGYFEPHDADPTECAASEGSRKYKETLLPTIDPASLAGGQELKRWISRHAFSMRQAMEMLQRDLYSMDEIRPVGALVKVFEW